jgi:hypothetical protein
VSEPPPQEGKYLGWLNAIKGLTISNVIVIAALAIVAVPVFVVYKAVSGNEKLLNRFLSTYEEETNQQSGCMLRHVQQRGGPDQWAVSSGFAFTGADRWFVSVVLNHAPGSEEIVSFCESLKLIADKMLDRGRGDGTAPTVQ